MNRNSQGNNDNNNNNNNNNKSQEQKEISEDATGSFSRTTDNASKVWSGTKRVVETVPTVP